MCSALLLLLCGCGRIGFDLLLPLAPLPAEDGGLITVDGGRVDAGEPGQDASVDGSGPLPGDAGGGMGDAGGGIGDAATDAGEPDAGDGGLADTRLRIGALPYPNSDAIWTRVIAAAPAVGIAVLNPSSGPGTSLSATFLERVQAAQAAGIQVYGYVPTMYTTRVASDVLDDVDRYVTWYAVDGFFVDQVSSTCGDQPYYQDLFDRIKQTYSAATVVLDPGTSVPECYIDAADILVTFQAPAAAYETFTQAAWQLGYPRERFWHLVYDAFDIAALNRVFDLAETRHVGFIYVTPDGLPDPWDTLPPDAYWAAELERAPQ